MTEEQIFLAALDLPDAPSRAKYLDEACGGDDHLCQAVQKLLAAHFKTGEFLDVPAAEQMAEKKGDTADNSGDAATIQSIAMPPNANAHDQSDSLEFLAPSVRSDSLGRIGHYEVLQVLGKGSFGIVLRAFDDVLQRVVAIKVMSPQLAATSPARKRFLREARSAAAVRHENIVQVYEVGEQPLPYLVMEFIPGETLQQRLDRVGPLDVLETLQIGRQIAEGLAAAHANDLIHRDIKPGNVLLEGSQHKVKITDFGLARAADDASMTQSGMIAGTPLYMAPEQALGKPLDHRLDLFSVGSVMYQMVAGRSPFRANNTVAVLKRVVEDQPRAIREIIPETPQWLCDIIAKLHAKNRDDRYQTARELAEVLADCEAQLKQSSRLRDFSRIPRSGRHSSWGRNWIAAVAGLTLLTVIAASVSEIAGLTHVFRDRRPNVAVSPPTEPITKADFRSTADGFVPLFNGRDLSGWKTHSDRPGRWSVEDGILTGSAAQGYLFTTRGDFEDFHLRVEAKVNRGGDSGIYFRTPFSLATYGRNSEIQSPAGGYVAYLHKVRLHQRPTGSVARETPERDGPPDSLFTVPDDDLVKADEWFTLEVIVRGNRIITKVNENVTADCSDPLTKYRSGHLALQVFSSRTVVQFRKVEIKELPPEEPGWVQLFNGKDLTGWKTHPEQPGDWVVTNAILVGHKSQSHLFTERDDFANFHLRAEIKVNVGGDSGIRIRVPFALQRGREAWQVLPAGGYEAEFNRMARASARTGSVWRVNPPHAPTKLFDASPGLVVLPNEWSVYEIVADENRIVTKLNGNEAANCVDTESMHRAGHIALQCFSSATVVQFRKIEIKELSSQSVEKQALPAGIPISEPRIPAAQPERPPDTP